MLPVPEPPLPCQLEEDVVARAVDGVAVVPQFDEHTVAPERLHQTAQLTAGAGDAVGRQRGGEVGHREVQIARIFVTHGVGQLVLVEVRDYRQLPHGSADEPEKLSQVEHAVNAGH